MTDFETVKGFLQELSGIVAEDPAEGIIVVEDEERGLTHLVVDCEIPFSSSHRGFWTCRRLLANSSRTPPPDESHPGAWGVCAR